MKAKGVKFQIPAQELKSLNFSNILNKAQLAKKQKCLKKGHNMALTLSLAQLKKLRNQPKTGGFIFTIPAILAALGAVGSLAGGSAAIAKTVIDAKKNKQELEEQKRHNEVMESSILTKGKGLKQRKKKLLKDLNRVKKSAHQL